MTRLEQARAARVALSWLFLLDGTAFGLWAGHLPSLQHGLLLSDAALGVVLSGMIIGAMVSMPTARYLVGRIGNHRVADGVALLYCAALPLPASALRYPFRDRRRVRVRGRQRRP